MIDLLYLAYNRLEFTKASWAALLENTNRSLVARLVVYDAGSTDGTREWLLEQAHSVQSPISVRSMPGAGPVEIMQHHIASDGMGIFAKIDSDTIVPPGWLGHCIDVMENNDLDLLGIEPPASRKVAGPTAEMELAPAPRRWVPCDAIGGIGLMRRSCFLKREGMKPHSTYGGFTEWQLTHHEVTRGWIAPALKVFLLDRLPIEPWKSLSAEYIAKGWQRPWSTYSEKNSELWDWWAQERVTA